VQGRVDAPVEEAEVLRGERRPGLRRDEWVGGFGPARIEPGDEQEVGALVRVVCRARVDQAVGERRLAQLDDRGRPAARPLGREGAGAGGAERAR